MKFTGIVATLAIAGAASAAAINPNQALTTTLANVDTVIANVENLTAGVANCADVTAVKQQLAIVQSQLQRIAGAATTKRDVLPSTAGSAFNDAKTTVEGAVADAKQHLGARDLVSGLTGGLLGQVTDLTGGLLSLQVLQNLQGLLGVNVELNGQNLVNALEQGLITPTQLVQALGFTL
ncbi:hypothetical protein M432DRAFT_635242 [Thermoascus aurantiacus ATCC 26904]